ncbi:MAG: hypothetical protein H6908_04280 [Hyphomicrobiales bacterium]|nr:hypothetical protein [Rickettsiales bacterium]MCP5361841.1 hypothetical protein [Hyphomicrobiales bacterium]
MNRSFFRHITLGICTTMLATANTAQARTVVIDDDAPYCREYTREIIIGGKRETAYGTACLQPDGTWEIQSENNSASVTEQETVKYVVQEPVVITRTYPSSFIRLNVFSHPFHHYHNRQWRYDDRRDRWKRRDHDRRHHRDHR